MSDLITHAERQERKELQERLAQRLGVAYKEALESQHAQTGGRVEIHVGQGVWDTLRAMVSQPHLPEWARVRATLWGFPILLEAAWETTRIEVWTKREIY